MFEVETERPHPQLKRYIRAFVQRSFRMHETEAVEPVIARLGAMLEFQFRDPYVIPSFVDDAENPCAPITVVGPISHRRVRLVIRGEVVALAVIFQPLGFYRFFGVPVSLLAERGTEGHSILGPRISALHEQLGNAPSFVQRVDLLNRFFRERAQSGFATEGVDRGLHALLVPGPVQTVDAVSRNLGISRRQLERRSLEYIGLPPKMLSRIARFQRALRMRTSNNKSWLEIAHASEYYDQMHMVRDFHVFAGDSPARSFADIAPEHLINF